MIIAHIKGRHAKIDQDLKKLCEAQKSLGYDVSIYPKHFSLLFYLLKIITFKKPKVVNIYGHSVSWNIYKKVFGIVDKVYIVKILNEPCEDTGQKDRRKKSKYNANNIQALVFPSSVIKESYGKSIKVDNIYIIPGGYDISLETTYNERQLAINKEIVGYGEICLDSNIHILIEAIRYLPKDFSIRWIGNGFTDNGYLREISDLAKNIGVENRVEIIIPKEEILDYNTIFYGATVYIDISDTLSYLNIIESLMRGIPVVSSKETNTEIKGYHYVLSRAPKSVANIIKISAGNEYIVDFNEILNEFSWLACAKKYDEVYTNLLKPTESK